MATQTYWIDRAPTHQVHGGYAGIAQNILDFADKSVSAADVVQAVEIPAGAYVTKVFVRVITAEGATCTATVGDGSGTNSWDASTDLNAAAGVVTATLEATDTYGVGKYYSAADTIDLVMGHDTDAAKIEVVATYFMKQTDQNY